MEGNVFLQGTKFSQHEKAPLVKATFDPKIRLIEKDSDFYRLARALEYRELPKPEPSC